MPAEPPWEWVEGSRRADLRYLAFLCTSIAVAIASFVFALLNLLAFTGLVAIPYFPSALTGRLVPLANLPAVVGLLLLSQSPPPLKRLGIPPLGLRTVLSLRTATYSWSQVTGVFPDSIEFRRGLRRVKYRLTRQQGERLAHFIWPMGQPGLGRPLP